MDDDGRMRCTSCGELIGAYEPIWWHRPDGGVALTSRLRLRDEPNASSAESAYYHEACGTRQSPTMP